MRRQLSALPRRSYHLARRTRRFAAMERRARAERAAGRARPALVRAGFTSDRLFLYPGIDDPATRTRYVSDLTTLRYRMFNGKSGELLTQKEVLLEVLAAQTDWRLDHRVAQLLGEDDDPSATLRRSVGDRGVVVVLRSMDSRAPRLLDVAAEAEPDAIGPPLGRSVLLLLGEDPKAIAAVHGDPLVVRITTYWGPQEAFVGHVVAASGGDALGRGWPVFGAQAQLTLLDTTRATPSGSLRLQRREDGVLVAAADPPLSLPTAAVVQRMEEVTRLATRFPNLRAVTWSFLVLGEELRFVDASNRLDLPYAQVFGPLLADPRLLSAYADAGAREARRLRVASGAGDPVWDVLESSDNDNGPPS